MQRVKAYGVCLLAEDATVRSEIASKLVAAQAPVSGTKRVIRLGVGGRSSFVLRIPAVNKAVSTLNPSRAYKAFQNHALSKKDLKFVAFTAGGGDLLAGGSGITQMIKRITPDGFLAGLGRVGMAPRGRLDAAASTAIMYQVGLSETQARELNGLMVAVGKDPPFAPYHELLGFRQAAAADDPVKQKFDTASIPVWSDKVKDYVPTAIEYWTCDVVNAVMEDIVKQLRGDILQATKEEVLKQVRNEDVSERPHRTKFFKHRRRCPKLKTTQPS